LKAYSPTTAGDMTSSSVGGGFAGGVEPQLAAEKPLPLGAHPPQVNIRAGGAPVNHFQTIQALPHMVHPQSGLGMPHGKI
jgi:hypothetical protein